SLVGSSRKRQLAARRRRSESHRCTGRISLRSAWRGVCDGAEGAQRVACRVAGRNLPVLRSLQAGPRPPAAPGPLYVQEYCPMRGDIRFGLATAACVLFLAVPTARSANCSISTSGLNFGIYDVFSSLD